MSQILIDRKKVGKFMALGGEHLVMSYGSSCVVKIPFGIRYFLRPRQYTSRIQDDYAILKRYFGHYFIETEVKVGERKEWYALIQRKYHGKTLTKDDLEANSDLRRQFLEILERNQDMVDEKRITWEFFGAWTLVFSNGRKVSNIIVEDGRRLMMADTGLIYLNNAHITHWLIRTIVRWAVKRQKKFLERLVK